MARPFQPRRQYCWLHNGWNTCLSRDIDSDSTAGFLNLGTVPVIRLVGGGQFRKGKLWSHLAVLRRLNFVQSALSPLPFWF